MQTAILLLIEIINSKLFKIVKALYKIVENN